MNTVRDWYEINDHLQRELSFDSFMDAIQFINEVAVICEEMNHHPDIELFAFRKLRIKLRTHDMNRISEKDYEQARKINQLISKN